jgi:hypothetical protein
MRVILTIKRLRRRLPVPARTAETTRLSRFVAAQGVSHYTL